MTSSRLRAWCAAALLLAAAFATGCSRSGALPDRDWHTLYRNLEQNPTTLDPAQVKDVAGGRIIAHIYGTLVTYDADGRLVGDLAESWEVSDDGRTYTFRLRGDAKFADGTTLTARHVADSFRRTLASGTRSPRTWVLDRIRGAPAFMKGAAAIEGLRVKGGREIEIELTEPFAPFLGLLTMPAAAVVPPGVTDFNEAGFGSGPFRVASFTPDKHLELERNPYYPGPGPEVDRVVYRIVAAPADAFRQGFIDVMEVPAEQVEAFRTDARTRDLIVTTDAANVYFLGINCASPRFVDVRARRALAHALDVDTIAAALYEGAARPARGPIPPGIPGYDPDVKGIPYDLARARALLDEAGFDRDAPLRFLCTSNTETVKICQALAGELKKAGLAVELMPREGGTFKMMLRNGDFDVYYYSWWADYFDAENFLAPLFLTNPDRSGGNPTAYSRPKVDALIRDAQREVDAAKRATLYVEIQRIVINDCPRVWLWHTQELTVRQPWVEGYRPSPIYNTDKGNLIRIVRPERGTPR